MTVLDDIKSTIDDNVRALERVFDTPDKSFLAFYVQCDWSYTEGVAYDPKNGRVITKPYEQKAKTEVVIRREKHGRLVALTDSIKRSGPDDVGFTNQEGTPSFGTEIADRIFADSVRQYNTRVGVRR